MSIATIILPFIPQRAPFVMIETLETCDAHGATTTFTVTNDNIFTENEVLTEPALVENIAQTAAAHMGYTCYIENKPVPIGFIGVIQQLNIRTLPPVGKQLKTSVKIINHIFNATIVEGTTICDDAVIANCEMRIFISNT